MVKIINQILNLLDELDDEDLRQFDVDIDTDVRSLSGGRRPMGPAHRQNPGSSQPPGTKRGREKFRAKRKVKKINRLLKEARRNGYDVDEIVQSNTSKPPLVRADSTDTGVDIIVDRGDARLEIEEGVATISFERIDHVESVPVTIETPVVETSRNLGVTAFRIRSADDTEQTGSS